MSQRMSLPGIWKLLFKVRFHKVCKANVHHTTELFKAMIKVAKFLVAREVLFLRFSSIRQLLLPDLVTLCSLWVTEIIYEVARMLLALLNGCVLGRLSHRPLSTKTGQICPSGALHYNLVPLRFPALALKTKCLRPLSSPRADGACYFHPSVCFCIICSAKQKPESRCDQEHVRNRRHLRPLCQNR